jgi:hypothetical protein
MNVNVGKIASIPGLLGILAYVLLDTQRPANIPAPLNAQAGSTGAVTTFASGANSQSAQALTTGWAEVDVGRLTSASPFANYRLAEELDAMALNTESTTDETRLSAEARQLTLSEMQQVAQRLSQQPVNYMFRSSRRNLIMLGDQVLEEGTRVSDGVEVRDIQRGRVVLTTTSDPSIDPSVVQ